VRPPPRVPRLVRATADAATRRLRRRLGLDATDALLTEVVADTGRLWRTADALRAVTDEHGVHVAAARERLGWLEARRAGIDAELLDVHARERSAAEAARRADATRDLLALGAWVAQLPPQATRVAVITPTRDRAHVVERALASVRAQTHTRWQHVIVDDGSLDGTADLLAAIDDPRVTVVRTTGLGNAGALNAGLAAVGEDVDVVTYLDDDNVMLPHWLAAVAWAFAARPDVSVLYGGRVIEADYPWPFIQAEPYDRALLERMNFMDQNVIAHRRGLPGVHYDTSLSHGADWDLALRLTQLHTPLWLPVLAVIYTTSGAGRLTDQPSQPASIEAIAARLLAHPAPAS
jgi:hypothetical protein